MVTYGELHNVQVADFYAMHRMLDVDDVCAALLRARERGEDRALAIKLAQGNRLTSAAREFVDNWQ